VTCSFLLCEPRGVRHEEAVGEGRERGEERSKALVEPGREVEGECAWDEEVCPGAEDNRNKEGLEEVLEGRIGRHIGIDLLCPVRRGSKDTIIGERREIDCLGGLEDHPKRGGWLVGLERIIATEQVVV